MKNKKIRIPIIFKIGLLGILIGSITSSIALSISNHDQVKRSKQTLIDNIDSSLSSLQSHYLNVDNGEELTSNLVSIKEYVNSIYQSNDIKNKTLKDFSSFDEYEEYFKESTTWIFPKDNLNVSKPYLDFKSYYKELTYLLNDAYLSSKARAAYIAYKVKENDETRLVFINDSRIYNKSGNDNFYHLPASHYVIKEEDKIIDNEDEDYYGYEINNYLTRFVPIYSTIDDKKEEVASVFIEYSLDTITTESRDILKKEIIILTSVTLASIIIYMVIAYFTITKNINKLNKVTKSIINNLNSSDEINFIPMKINTHDEISSLSSSFETMEKEINNYVGIIKKETKENERRNTELEIAKNIQLGSLPSTSYFDNNICIEASILPAKTIGGDFFDYFYNNDELVFIVGDVSGKGISASLLMMKVKTLLKTKILSCSSLVKAISEVNNDLAQNNELSLFVTAFIGTINFKTNILKYINCGHELPYLIRNNKIEKIKGKSNFVLGGVTNFNFVEEKIKLDDLDTLFVYTDGISDATNINNERFSNINIEKSLNGSINLSINDKKNNILKDISSFTNGNEQFDDITLLILKLNSPMHFSISNPKIEDISLIINSFEKEYYFLDEKTKSHVSICIDELLSNLIKYENKKDLKVDVDFIYQKETLKVVITSNSKKFNPFEYKIKEEKEIGGKGLLIVKNIVKKHNYEYKNNLSIITLYF